jgi:hypothetical protein
VLGEHADAQLVTALLQCLGPADRGLLAHCLVGQTRTTEQGNELQGDWPLSDRPHGCTLVHCQRSNRQCVPSCSACAEMTVLLQERRDPPDFATHKRSEPIHRSSRID